ncbi:MurR/RpiR family transcriptional regulator [Mollicutes bacterium LVI A0078]|nr:MurR/RpiR family transcriptional regulator [Mollicutes bacterium LVI A0075]WOO91418.1 MurR/RpiR family transcriptional regulator [Mollicutes bacterium LVI A0078]
MKSVISYLQRKQLEETSQGQLAKFILEYKDDISTLTVRELTQKAYVSSAAATRLAKSYGYSGYTELKYELLKELEGIDKQQKQYSNQVVDNYINTYFSTILNTTNSFDYQLIKDIAKSILINNEVAIFANGSTLLRAMDFEYRLRRLGIRIISCMDFDQQRAQSKILNRNTTCIAISYSGTTENVVRCVDNLIDNNVPCYLISTNNKFDADCIKHVTLSESEPISRNFSISSNASVSYVLDLIFLELLNLNPTSYNEKLSSTKQ